MRILCFIRACFPKVATGFGDKDMRSNKVSPHEDVGGFCLLANLEFAGYGSWA